MAASRLITRRHVSPSDRGLAIKTLRDELRLAQRAKRLAFQQSKQALRRRVLSRSSKRVLPQWLERAENADYLAKEMDDPEAKRGMQDVAKAYRRIAQRAVWRKSQDLNQGLHAWGKPFHASH
jgi:hypothetical protein